VLLRGPNNPWLVASWFGVVLAGGVAVTTMPLLRAAELSTICDIAKVDLALCDARFSQELHDVVPRIFSYDGTAPPSGELGPHGFGALMRSKPTDFTPVQTAADDVAMIAFTSGTTGRPKAAMHFHRDVLAVADTFSAHVLKPTPDDVFAGS